MLLETIQMIAYCGARKRMYREMKATICYEEELIGRIDVEKI